MKLSVTNGFFHSAVYIGVALLTSSGCLELEEPPEVAAVEQSVHNHRSFSGTYIPLLQNRVRFNKVKPGADAVSGQARFGLGNDGQTEDKTDALFEGFSQAAQGQVTSNQRTCFSCHRGPSENFGLPPGPLMNSIDPQDELFTGADADGQGDPDTAGNLDDFGLIKIRPNRFNPKLAQSDPLRQVFGWRKTPNLVNVGFGHGFLTDLRGRNLFETARGAVFSHTQTTDTRFDDLFSLQDGIDIEAFLFTIVSDPALLALHDPQDPMFDTLVTDSFYTVNITTAAQRRGKRVFKRQCMSCHNTPNIFNNLANVEPQGNTARLPTDPTWGPGVGMGFNIGIAERNLHGLRFTRHVGNGVFEPIVVPLAEDNGDILHFVVDQDIGLAASTQRVGDIGRFKVPQLRDVRNNAPYFHDNSALTLEEVVDYFNSPAYNDSKDGRRYPVHLTPRQRSDLLEFLNIL